MKASTRGRAKQQRHAMLENVTAGRQNNVADVSASRLKAYRPLLSLDFPLSHPTQVPSRFINVKTAKALGLTIPPSLLLRADQIIE